MRKALCSVLVIAALAASGCTVFRGRSAPNEFEVARNAPLIIPPEYNLTPPVAGTAGISAGDAQQQAIDALFGGPAPRSEAETSILERAGRSSAQIGIRSTVWDPDTRIVDTGPTTLQILAAQPSNSNIASAQSGQ